MEPLQHRCSCPIPHSNNPLALHQEVTELERLTQKLGTAEKKIDEYARLIASLYAEQKQYQDIICHPCKEQVLRVSLAIARPSSGVSQPSSQPIIAAPNIPEPRSAVVASSALKLNCTRSSVQAGPGPPLPSAPSLAFHDRSTPISQLLESPGNRGSSNPEDLILSSSSSDNPQANVAALSTPAVSPYSEQPHPSLLSTTENPTNAGRKQSKPHYSDWSVEYNPEIKQPPSLRVTKTFGFTAKVFCAKFSRDGKYLAVGLQDGETHIYDMTTGSKSTILAERPATVFYTEATKAWSEIWAVQFTQDNKYIAIGDHKGQINIWELARRRLRASLKHRNLVRSLDISPDGRFLVSASYDKSVGLWRIRDGSRKNQWWHGPSEYRSVAFSPDGRYAAAGDYPGSLWIWDVRTGRLVVNSEIGADATVALRSVAFMPDGKGITTGGNTLQCWDIGSLRGIRLGRGMILDGTINKINQIWEFNGHRDNISAVSVSFDKRWIVSGSMDHNVFLLDARSGAWVCILKGHLQRVWAADFSPAGHYLVSGGQDCLLRLWKYDVLK